MDRKAIIISASIIIGLILVSLFIKNEYFTFSLIYAMILILLSISWDFSSGTTGYVNFGIPFFMGVGAFSAGYFYFTFKLPVPVLLTVAFLFGIISGFIFSIPTLRLRGPFFTLLSLLLPLLGADFILAFWTVLGLPTIGYYGLPHLAYTPNLELTQNIELLIVGVFVLIFSVILHLISKSHFGLVLRAVGDDEDAVISNGVNSFPYKLLTFSLAMGISALGGGIYALFTTYAGIDTFGLTFLLYPMLIAIFGGRGSIMGSIPGGIIIVLAAQYLSLYIGSLTLITFAAFAVILVLFFPKGLMKVTA